MSTPDRTAEPLPEVTFTYGAEEIAVLRGLLPTPKRLLLRFAPQLFGLGLGLLPLVILLAHRNLWGAAAFALLMSALTVCLVVRTRRRMQEAMSKLPAMSLSMAADGLTCRSPEGWSQWLWSGVEGVETTDRHLLIHVATESLGLQLQSRRSTFVVSQNAFASRAALEAFASAVRHYRATASSAPPDSPLPISTDRSRSTQVITYRNTLACAERCARVARANNIDDVAPRDGGQRQSGAPTAVRLGLRTMLLTAGLVFFFLANREAMSRQGGVLSGVLPAMFVLILEVCVFTLGWLWLQRRRFRTLTFPLTTLTISRDGLLYRGERARHLTTWNRLRRVRPLDGGVVLIGELNQVLHYLPASAFSDAQQAMALVETIEQYCEAAADACQPSGEVVVAPPSNNPYQAPLTGG